MGREVDLVGLRISRASSRSLSYRTLASHYFQAENRRTIRKTSLSSYISLLSLHLGVAKWPAAITLISQYITVDAAQLTCYSEW